jgi:hypothetical protein
MTQNAKHWSGKNLKRTINSYWHLRSPLLLDLAKLFFSETLNSPVKKEYMAEAKRMTEEYQPRCINCGNFIDDCICVCPYCGETAKCTCCIGVDKATGGG